MKARVVARPGLFGPESMLPRLADERQAGGWTWVWFASPVEPGDFEVTIILQTDQPTPLTLARFTTRITVSPPPETPTALAPGGTDSPVAPGQEGDSGGIPWAIAGIVAVLMGAGGMIPLFLFVVIPRARRVNSPNVFLSYRRGDAAGWVGRINDHLAEQLGEDHVFQDIMDIEGGADWATELGEKVASCDVLIALIGNRWVGPETDGTRRIDQDDDWVRIETAKALQRDCVVIPVLVDGMTMATLGTLPEDLSRLRRRNAIEISPVHFEADVKRLVQAIRGSRITRRDTKSGGAKKGEATP